MHVNSSPPQHVIKNKCLSRRAPNCRAFNLRMGLALFARASASDRGPEVYTHQVSVNAHVRDTCDCLRMRMLHEWSHVIKLARSIDRYRVSRTGFFSRSLLRSLLYVPFWLQLAARWSSVKQFCLESWRLWWCSV